MSRWRGSCGTSSRRSSRCMPTRSTMRRKWQRGWTQRGGVRREYQQGPLTGAKAPCAAPVRDAEPRLHPRGLTPPHALSGLVSSTDALVNMLCTLPGRRRSRARRPSTSSGGGQGWRVRRPSGRGRGCEQGEGAQMAAAGRPQGPGRSSASVIGWMADPSTTTTGATGSAIRDSPPSPGCRTCSPSLARSHVATA